MSVLELFSRFELSMHSKARFLVHVASPNPHSCERLKVNFHRSHLVRQFSAFRNFQETCFVIYCLIINVLLLFSCDSLVRISHHFYVVNNFFKIFYFFLSMLSKYKQVLATTIAKTCFSLKLRYIIHQNISFI